MTMEFDQTALENWVALCAQEQQMRESGASADELLLIRTRVILEMTQLLPTLSEEEKAVLALVLLSSENNEPIVTPTNEVSDPIEIGD